MSKRGAPDSHAWQAPIVTRQSGDVEPYAFEITTSKNVAKGSPTETTLTLAKGFVNFVRLRIPPGHAGLTGISFFSDTTQLWPLTPGTFFVGDDELIGFGVDIDVPLVSTVYKLVAKTYNTDDTYSHGHHCILGVVRYP